MCLPEQLVLGLGAKGLVPLPPVPLPRKYEVAPGWQLKPLPGSFLPTYTLGCYGATASSGSDLGAGGLTWRVGVT